MRNAPRPLPGAVALRILRRCLRPYRFVRAVAVAVLAALAGWPPAHARNPPPPPRSTPQRRRRQRIRRTPGRAATGHPASPGSTATSTPLSRRRRRLRKPLFLYWGAEWCPPCAQIKVDDLQSAGVPGAQSPVRAGLPGRRHAERAEAGRALRRGGLPDDDPVPAGRNGDHTAARQRGRRTLRQDSRRRAGRCAAGEGDPRRRHAGRRGLEQRLAVARLLFAGRRTTDASSRPRIASQRSGR